MTPSEDRRVAEIEAAIRRRRESVNALSRDVRARRERLEREEARAHWFRVFTVAGLLTFGALSWWASWLVVAWLLGVTR